MAALVADHYAYNKLDLQNSMTIQAKLGYSMVTKPYDTINDVESPQYVMDLNKITNWCLRTTLHMTTEQ